MERQIVHCASISRANCARNYEGSLNEWIASVVEVKAVEHWATNTVRGGLKRGQCHLVVRNWSGHGRALIALTVFDTGRCLLLLFVNSLDMSTRSSLASLFTIASRQVVNPVAVLQEQDNTITFLLSLWMSPY